MSALIETDNLSRYFGEIKAVEGISFKANEGDVLGFLGPNGAGKSTTMKLLTCFLAPTSGTARVGGFDIKTSPREVRQLIGYLPENAPLYGEMTVIGFLRFVAEVRGLVGGARESAVERVVGLTSLEQVLAQRIETLSKGFRRRVGLAQSLVHDPKILILDEPTDGLDPNQKHEVRQLINGMAKDKCIVLSTHILEEVEVVCNRAVIIARGRLVADETPESLRRRSKHHGAILLSVRKPAPGDIREKLLGLPGVRNIQERHDRDQLMSVTVYPQDNRELLSPLVKLAERERWQFEHLSVQSGGLDEVFREITARASGPQLAKEGRS